MLPFRLLLITDVTAAAGAARGVVETIARALDGPLPASPGMQVAVLVRDKRASLTDVARTCRAVNAIATRAGALTLVHTHASLVAELGLAGVHLSSHATASDITRAREAAGARAIVGASRHASDVHADMTADYVTLSPVFAPHSKRGDTRVRLGLDGLHVACARAHVKVFALGGVDEESARACRIVGAHGVAVLGRVMRARAPYAVVRDLAAALH